MHNKLKFIPIKKASKIKELFKSLSKEYVKLIYQEEEEICSFGIFTDSDISNYYFGYNTKEGMEEIIKEGISEKENEPESEFKIDYMKWWLPEWMNAIDNECFMDDEREIELFKTMEKLIEKTDNEEEDLEDEYFSNYKDDIFDLFCESLAELRDENVFSKVAKDFILLVQESDNGISGNKIREKSISKLLTNIQIEDYKSFEKRWMSF